MISVRRLLERLLAGDDSAVAEVLSLPEDAGLGWPEAAPLARLVEAAAGEGLGGRAAARLLNLWRLGHPRRLGELLAVLETASPAALEVAGDWLFFPEVDDELALLAPLVREAPHLRELCRRRPGDWCREGLDLVLPLAGEAVPPTTPETTAPIPEHWLPLLESLARCTAREGLRAQELALHLSRRLGRVVVLLGNASLGGPPLWAVSGPWQTCPALAAEPRPPAPRRRVERLARLRARRLGGPLLLRALWGVVTAWRVGGGDRRELDELLEQARPWLTDEESAGLREGRLALSPGRLPLEPALALAREALERARRLERQGRDALRLVYGLAAAGNRLLARGEAEAVVLPWIDKLVASTKKAGDHAQLVGLCRLLSRLAPPPLVMLVDETVHPAEPSLVRVLEAASRQDPALVLRGVGAFNLEPEPGDLEGALLATAEDAHLVALRPLPGPAGAPTLAELATGRGRGEPVPHSREGCDWLLAGTPLAELVDREQAAAGSEPGHLPGPRGPLPAGVWFRRRVRDDAGWQPPRHKRRLWLRYLRACSLD